MERSERLESRLWTESLRGGVCGEVIRLNVMRFGGKFIWKQYGVDDFIDLNTTTQDPTPVNPLSVLSNSYSSWKSWAVFPSQQTPLHTHF